MSVLGFGYSSFLQLDLSVVFEVQFDDGDVEPSVSIGNTTTIIEIHVKYMPVQYIHRMDIFYLNRPTKVSCMS